MSAVPPSWLFGAGVIVAVGTHDAEGEPHASRAVCARLAEDGRTILLYMSVPEGLTALDNVSANGHIAATFTQASDYRSQQLKGTDARLVSLPDDETFVRERYPFILQEFLRAGYSTTFMERMWSLETVTVAFTPDGAWDQTPGPDAGRELPR